MQYFPAVLIQEHIKQANKNLIQGLYQTTFFATFPALLIQDIYTKKGLLNCLQIVQYDCFKKYSILHASENSGRFLFGLSLYQTLSVMLRTWSKHVGRLGCLATLRRCTGDR